MERTLSQFGLLTPWRSFSVDKYNENLVNPCIRVTCEVMDEAFANLKRVIGTSAVHPRIVNVLTFTRRAVGRNHNVSMQLEDIAKCSCAVCACSGGGAVRVRLDAWARVCALSACEFLCAQMSV